MTCPEKALAEAQRLAKLWRRRWAVYRVNGGYGVCELETAERHHRDRILFRVFHDGTLDNSPRGER